MDIVSISAPPARGRLLVNYLTKTKCKFYQINLSADDFAKRYYEDQVVKFIARLLQDSKPVFIREFLQRVDLKVTFKVSDDQARRLSKKSNGYVLGEFSDDGKNLDERANDGVFTVEMNVNVSPGKYIAKITSGNDVLFRSIEKEVVVYPSPVKAAIELVESDADLRQFVFSADDAVIAKGSLAVHAEVINPDEVKSIYQGVEKKTRAVC